MGVGGGGGRVRMKLKMLGHQSTEESFIKMSILREPSPPPLFPPLCCNGVGAGELVSCGGPSSRHAHSDGRLLAICRHKHCSCRRTNTPRERWRFWTRASALERECRDGREQAHGAEPFSNCLSTSRFRNLFDLECQGRRASLSYPDVIPFHQERVVGGGGGGVSGFWEEVRGLGGRGDLRGYFSNELRVRGHLLKHGEEERISVL
jgi:hypothetical protein